MGVSRITKRAECPPGEEGELSPRKRHYCDDSPAAVEYGVRAGSPAWGEHKGIQDMFDYDWFRGRAFEQQKHDAKVRCARKHFPNDNPEHPGEAYRRFFDELEARVLIYLRDGFSYEFKELANVSTGSHLTFECEPVDEHYKVGAFVVAVPFEDIVRVEVFAVHPSEKPEDVPLITVFCGGPETPISREDQGEAKHR